MTNIEQAAQKLAELFDYPWQYMPEKGRETMRANVRAVLQAAGVAQPKAQAQAAEPVGTVYVAGWNAHTGFTLAGALDQGRVKEGDKLYLLPEEANQS